MSAQLEPAWQSMTREEFAERQVAARNRAALLMFAPFAVLGAAGFGYMYFTARGGRLSDAADSGLGWTLLVILIGTLVAATYGTKLIYRRYRLVCPQCGKLLNGTAAMVAMATCRCGRCGSVVLTEIAEPGTPPNAGPATPLGNSEAAGGPPSVS